MKHTLRLCGLLAGFSLAAAPELVMVGDAGNPGKKVYFHEVPNPYPRGGVAYPYRIGRSEVSNAEYAEFLNACAAESDPHRLFDERMKIVRSGGEAARKRQNVRSDRRLPRSDLPGCGAGLCSARHARILQGRLV